MLQAGIFYSLNDIEKHWKESQQFKQNMARGLKETLLARWQCALSKVL